MQINLQSPLLKEFLKYLGWILLFVFLWLNGCNRSEFPNGSVKAIIPEVKRKLEAKKPFHEAVSSKMERTATRKEILQVENPINKNLIAENEKLKIDFAKETDSLKKVIAYNKAIKLNAFSTKFEDENVVLNINGVVQGEVKEVTPNYTIKEKKIEVPVKVKETVFRLLGGLELGNNTQLNDFKLKANLMFQNRKGNVLSGSFDTNQTVWVGYNMSIFNIKK